jgi:hypothetical protein
MDVDIDYRPSRLGTTGCSHLLTAEYAGTPLREMP